MGFPGPQRLPDSSEFVHAIPDGEQNWSENFCDGVYDWDRRVSVWLHLGREAYKPDLWHEISVVGLPDGRFLVTKGHGRGQHERGPGSATMSFDCVEPWNHWVKRLDGSGLIVSGEHLAENVFTDGVHVPVDWELDYTALCPPWDVGADMEKQTWGRVHYSQICRVTGSIAYDGQQTEFEGMGIRDHTRGPRNYAANERHIWLHAYFPESGRGFHVLENVVHDGPVLRVAATYDGTAERLTPVELTDSPHLAPGAGPDEPYSIGMRGRDGEFEIHAKQVHDSMPYCFAGKTELLIGKDRRTASHVYYEGFTEFEWDGEIGYGLTERSRPIEEDPLP